MNKKRRKGNALIVYIVLMATMAIAAAETKNIGEYINKQRMERADKFISEVGMYVEQLYFKGLSIVGSGSSTTAVYDLLDGAGFPGICTPQSELVRIANVTSLNLVSKHSDHAYLDMTVTSKKVLFPSVMRGAVNRLNRPDGTVSVVWNKSSPDSIQVRIHFRRGR
ncbi:hypothetical protein [Thermovirga lienii]|uniref:hypothetical protein n=1 Tax=Thermovirga lienii TaxID=336261 RepID=UPI002FE3F8DC